MSHKEVTSSNAYRILINTPKALLVDVRTDYEWQQIGIADIKQGVVLLSWRLLPNMMINDNFLVDFDKKIAKHSVDLFFMCRSGMRSREAASYITNIRTTVNCYNIIDGFEGNTSGAGWLGSKLPMKFIKVFNSNTLS